MVWKLIFMQNKTPGLGVVWLEVGLDFAAGSGALGLGGTGRLARGGGLCGAGGLSARSFGRGSGATAASGASLFGVGGDLVLDAGSGFSNSFDVAGEFVNGEDEAEGVGAMVELVGFF